MAFIDYGSVVKKNGKIIQKDSFMNMKEAVGFTINKIKQSYKDDWECWLEDDNYNKIKLLKTPKHKDYNVKVNGNYFSYIGDKDLLICIYKEQVTIISHGHILKNEYLGWFGNVKKYNLSFEIAGVKFHIKRLFNENRYKMRFEYKGNLYEVLFGYGVDVNKKIWYYSGDKEKIWVYNWFKEE